MLQIDYEIDLSQIDFDDESLSMVEMFHQIIDGSWTTTLIHESEVLNFQDELDALNLDYLPVV